MQVIDFTSADRIMSEGHTSKGDQPKWKQSGNGIKRTTWDTKHSRK